MRRAVLVAHPDDETLWFGGLVIAEPGDWTVICCSIPRTDPVRAWKLFDACRILGATARLLPYTEPGPEGELVGLAAIDLGGFGEVYTHNSVGEYGHRHHRQVHRFALAAAAGRVLVSGYGSPLEAEKVIALDAGQRARKTEALAAYDHVSPSDGRPKWQALLARYGTMFDLGTERYARP